MANKRMISTPVIDDDKFLDLSFPAQALYFHLCFRADDDGFLTPKRIMRATRVKPSSLKELVKNGYILEFSSGPICIKHWLTHNRIRSDCYHPSIYPERSMVEAISVEGRIEYMLKDQKEHGVAGPPWELAINSGRVTISSRNGCDDDAGSLHCRDGLVTDPLLQVSSEKESKDYSPASEGVMSVYNCTRRSDSPEKNNAASGGESPSPGDVESYFRENHLHGNPRKFYYYYVSTGWKDKNGREITDWKARARLWSGNDGAKSQKVTDVRKPRDCDGSYAEHEMEDVILE